MKTISSIFLVLVFFFSFNIFVFAQPASNISQSGNQFSFDLYSHLSSNKGNVFFSPYSIYTALSMTYEGARGETAQQMSTVLRFLSDQAARRAESAAFIQQINRTDKSYELSVANALWAQKAYPFKGEYLSIVKDIYFAEAHNLDFVSSSEASRVTINSWVSDKTKNRINDLLPSGSITKDTRLVLTDAVYFKGKWETPFKKQDTRLDVFWLDPGQSVQTDMMSLVGESFDYTDNDHVQVLKLPYQGNDLSMLIVLPRSKDIQSVEKTLTLGMLKQWQIALTSQKVNVFLPKFKFDASYEMSDILMGMGMKLAFDQNYADFSGMAHKIIDQNLYISGVFHKAWIETNEEGTEAAAATGIALAASQAVEIEVSPKIFEADRPFLFLIQDNKTGHILFMGRVSDPREK